jgi:hypothetical protein
LKAQRECNSKLAAVAYQARAISPDYTAPTAHDIARHFHLEHRSPLRFATHERHSGSTFPGPTANDEELSHLRAQAPDDLYRLASGHLTFDAYIGPARAAAAEFAARKASEEAAEACAHRPRKRPRVHRDDADSKPCTGKYGVSLTDESLMPRMTKLLQLIDAGNRLPQDELVWLSTEARSHFTERLQEAYHLLEAEFHADQYRQHPGSVERYQRQRALPEVPASRDRARTARQRCT